MREAARASRRRASRRRGAEPMSSAWLWAVAGLLLVGAEVLAPGVFLLWLGIAALITAGLTALLPISLAGPLRPVTNAAGAGCVSRPVGFLRHRPVRAPPVRRAT